MKSFLRSASAVVLALLLVVVPISENIALAADPVSATVTVATSGSLGAGLGAVATSPVTAVVGALVLGALGVNAFVSSAAQAQGETKTEWISRKMQEYAEVQGSNYAQLEKDIAYNTYVTSDGILHLQRSAAEKIKSFGDWLIGGGEVGSVPVYEAIPDLTLGISALYPGAVVVGSAGDIFKSPVLPATLNGTQISVSANDSRGDTSSFSGYFCFLSNASGSTVFGLLLRNGPVKSLSMVGYYGDSLSGKVGSSWTHRKMISDFSLYTSAPSSVVMPVGNFSRWDDDSLDLISPASGIVGNPVDWAQNEDVINLGIPDGGAVSVNPDLLGGLDLSNIATDKVIGLGDYLDALADAINGLSDRVIDLHDALALDDVIALPIPDDLTPGITVPVDPAITVPDTSVNVIEGTKPAYPTDPSNPSNPDTIIANYSYDLTSVFPFCIPFDIVRALEKLNATPEAPAFSYRFKYDAIGLDYTLSVDLSAWDSVAAVLRTMEVLLFTIGLGLVSRKLIMA